MKEHKEKVEIIVSKLKKLLQDKKPLKFIHGSTNSTRTQVISNDYNYLDISDLNEVLSVDEEKLVAIAEPGVTMKKLVEATLKKGLMPKVVPEFPNITIGGAFQGAALESTSFKFGQVSDTISEIEVVTAGGETINASPKKNSDLFYGMSGSYGTLGLVTSLKIELIKAKDFVRIFLVPINTSEVVSKIKEISENPFVDFLEAITFSPQESVIIYGRFDIGGRGKKVSFNKTLSDWFYVFAEKHKHAEHVRNYLVKTEDYLFRYDHGAFWAGNYVYEALHLPFNKITRAIFHRFTTTKILYEGLHRSNLSHKYLFQDFYLGSHKVQSFLNFVDKKVRIHPIWLCPILNTTTEQFLSPHYQKEKLLIDVGVWGKIKAETDEGILNINREIMHEVYEQDGRQMFYADVFLTEGEMWKYYDKKKYIELKEKYDPDYKLSEIWKKIHSDPSDNKTRLFPATIETFALVFKGKLD